MIQSHPFLNLLRWITTIAVGGAVLALVVDLWGMQGPWRSLALPLAATGLVAFLIVLQLVYRQLHAASSAVDTAVGAVKAKVNEAGAKNVAEFDALRHEIEEYRRLQSALTEAKLAAESAVQAKGEFLATMSHEVRTPLNGIIPMLDLLQSSKLAVDQREMLNIALQSAHQLLRIVDDILDYSKLEANRLQLESVNINLRELLDSVTRLLERQAQIKGLRLTLHVAPNVRPSMRGDPLRLRQIVSNLVSNALKFTERGSIAVNVSRLGETRTHHQLRFEVSDTGVGISPEAASKLFSAFSQADASTTRVYGGTGLGLAICKRIVDLMGGRIGVDSETGRGSLFWFEVPLLKAIGEIEGRRAELHGARALVLATDPALRQRLAQAFAHWGVDVSFVTTTHDALNQLRANAARPRGYDLLLADLGSIRSTQVALQRNLAGMEGIEGLRYVFIEGNETVPSDVREIPNSLVVSRTIPDTELRLQITRLLAGETISGAGRESEPAVTLAPIAPPRISSVLGQLSGRLLLVEDNPVNLAVAQRLISLSGMHCDTTENGEQALVKLSCEHYDIVLMDCQMPVMDGYSATQAWRRQEAEQGLPHLPIIAMTANAMADDRQKCLDAGMDDYLSKPVSRELLEETLGRWLASSERSRTLTEPMPRVAVTPIRVAHPTDMPAIVPAPETIPMHSKTQPAMAHPPLHASPLDAAIVEDLQHAMGEQFRTLVTLFLEDAPGHLAKLEAAAVLADNAQMAAAAHALKSSSANLGAMQVSTICQRIEHCARDNNLPNPVVAVTLLGAEFHRAEAELRRLL